MRDRVPKYPGRVRLTPVSGQTNVYDLTRADEPEQEGTKLNKNSLLTDAVAATLGLGTDATPNDAFSVVAERLSTVDTNALQFGTGSWTGTGITNANTSKITIPCTMKPNAVIYWDVSLSYMASPIIFVRGGGNYARYVFASSSFSTDYARSPSFGDNSVTFAPGSSMANNTTGTYNYLILGVKL